MLRQLKILAVLVFSMWFVFFSPMTYSASTAKNILPPPQKLSEHVYAWIGPLPGPSKENHGYRMNLVFVLGSKSIAVIDTGYTETIANEMLAYIRGISDKPIKYAINSNSQPHRVMGNDVFAKAGASIISHVKTAARVKQMSGNYAGIIERILELPKDSVNIPKPADRIIDVETQLDLGDISIILNNLGPAHTPAQLVVHIPSDKLVYTGDILYSERLLAVLSDSNIKSWLKAFDKLKQYGDVTFIPGHGHPGQLNNFEFSTRNYLMLLFTHMTKMVDEGVDVQDAINQLDQSAYSKLVNFEELSGRNASWAYLEREAASFE